MVDHHRTCLSSSLDPLQAARKGHLEVLPRAVTAIGGATVPLFLDRHELTDTDRKGGKNIKRCRALFCRHGQGLMSSLNTTIVPGSKAHQKHGAMRKGCARGVDLHALEEIQVQSSPCAQILSDPLRLRKYFFCSREGIASLRLL